MAVFDLSKNTLGGWEIFQKIIIERVIIIMTLLDDMGQGRSKRDG